MMRTMKQSMRRLVVNGGDGGFFQSNLSTFGYFCVCLIAIFFGYILNTDISTSQSIYSSLEESSWTQEDSYIENLTAILFFLIGLLLVVVAITERRIFQRCIYILGCIAFLFAAGEEISWGQRIFDFETPDSLMEINRQNELSIHNIETDNFSGVKITNIVYIHGTFVFCIIICAAFFCNRNSFLGFPLPSIPLMFSFLIMLSHKSTYSYIFATEEVLLLILIVYTLFTKKITLTVYATATMILIMVIPYVYHHTKFYLFTGEVREFLFSVYCFIYSLELLQARKIWPFKRIAVIQDYPSRVSRTSLAYTAGIVFIISGSIYLVSLKNTRSEIILSLQQKALRFLNDADPIIRSNFDVYLRKESLIYVRNDCDSEDTNARFFLHIVPNSQSDLPHSAKQYGFDNLDFDFKLDGFFDGQRCIVIRFIPKYSIAKITTGQYVGDRQIWNGTFRNVP